MAEDKPKFPSSGNSNNQPPHSSGVSNPDEKKNQEKRKEQLGPAYQVRLRRGGDKEIYVNGRGYRFNAERFIKIPEKDFLHIDIQNAKSNFIIINPVKESGVNNGK